MKKYRIIQAFPDEKKMPLIFQQLMAKEKQQKAQQENSFTNGQMAYHDRLQRAVLYGKNAVADPEKKEVYEASAKPPQSAFNVAVADFLSAPDIKSIDLSKYNGQPGEKITIEVTDNFKVTKVHVLIENNDGSGVEEGFAIKHEGNVWSYISTVINDKLDGDKITITAFDMPENVSGEVISL